MDFMSALNQKASEVKKPLPLPAGSYTWRVVKHANTTSKNGEWDIIEFTVEPVAASDDIDPDDLAAFGPLKAGTNRVAFMFPKAPTEQANFDRTLHNLKQFLTRVLRVEYDEDTDPTIAELLAGSTNCIFIASAEWRQDGEDTYVDVKRWMPATSD